MKNNTSGQSLIEVLVALSAAIVVLSSITFLILTSLNQAVGSKNTALAAQHAQQGMELAKTQPANLSVGTRYCVGSSGLFSQGACTGANLGIFKREALIEGTSCGTLKKVTVTVSWSDSKCTTAFCQKVIETSCI